MTDPIYIVQSSEQDELGALKLKWKRKKHDFTEQELLDILNPIAEVDSLALSERKKGTAVVMFKTVVDAVSFLCTCLVG
jgi:DnaJ family protein C protein 17